MIDDPLNQPVPPEQDSPLVGHLIELRRRLLYSAGTIIAIFIGLFYFSSDLYTFLALPIIKHLPHNSQLIATGVAAPFITPFKLTFFCSLFAAIPVLLYHFWAFISPGLYKKEQRLVFPLLFSSSLLFYAGMAFAYFVVFPLVFGFFTSIAPTHVTVMPDMTQYLDFTLKLFFAFGAAFEVPIATVLLIWTGAISRQALAAKRPYVIVAAFVLGMLLTPPDVISQVLLAIPIWLLFELGLLFSRFFISPPLPCVRENG